MNWTREQSFVIDWLAGPLLLVAVAGAGKTTVLLGRIKRLLERTGLDSRGGPQYGPVSYPCLYEPLQEVRVQVEHTFYLSVPFAGRLLALLDRTDGRRLEFGPGEYGLVIYAATSLTNEGESDFIEVEYFEP